MKTETLKEIIKKKSSKEEFAVLTNLSTGNSEIYISKKLLSKEFENYKNEIENYYNLKKNDLINRSEIFIFMLGISRPLLRMVRKIFGMKKVSFIFSNNSNR